MKPLLLAVGAALAAAAPFAARAETACADLAATKLPHAQVTASKVEALRSGQACLLSVTSRPTSDSEIKIEVMIPIGGAWNGKFVQVGNGGLAGSIPSAQIKLRAESGYAAAGTDDGHGGDGRTATWAYHHPEKIVDFASRSLKETTEAAKALIAAQKGSGPKRSYFVGCSAGGREALMEAQRFPGDFDGIVAGAPANYMSQLFGISAAQQQALAAPGGYLGPDQRALLQKAALAQCADGGTFIRDPMSCHFDPGKLQCKAGQADGCLTAAQVHSARVMYEGRRDPRTGKIAFPGFSPGAEAAPNSWSAWVTGQGEPDHGRALGLNFSSNAFKYFAFQDPSYDFLKMDLGAEFDRGQRKMAHDIDAANPNLSAFKAHGGKLIQYHGWNDPAIPARSSIRYYEDVRKTMGDTAGFYRLYLIPGMLHCGGGAAPTQVDWLSELDGWVTEDKAPGAVTAKGAGGASQLLCPYPAVARKAAEGWACPARKPAAKTRA